MDPGPGAVDGSIGRFDAGYCDVEDSTCGLSGVVASYF